MSVAQLRACGLTREAIAHRARHGRLTRLHRGVYLAGPIASPLSHPLAALLACGPGAALSHRAAGALWELTAPAAGPIDVTVSGGNPRHAGIRVHRASLEDGDVTTHQGLAITTPQRTLVDLAAILPRRATERAVEQAHVRGLTSYAALVAHLHGAGPRPGAGGLRAILDRHVAPSLTRSEAEQRLLDLIRSAGLPQPLTNTRIGAYEVDALWPRERLVVEVDGYAFHGTREAFERDRVRDAELQLAGHRVVRVTWRQLTREPHRVVATLSRALSRGSGS